MINDTHRDKDKWRVCERTAGKLINVKQDAGRLEGDVALGDAPAVVGHVKATLANGEFSYRLDWSGAKSDVTAKNITQSQSGLLNDQKMKVGNATN